MPAPGTKVAGPLKAPLKLDISAKPLPAMPLRNNLDQAYEEFKRVYANNLTARDQYFSMRNQCAARSFSIFGSDTSYEWRLGTSGWGRCRWGVFFLSGLHDTQLNPRLV